VKDEHTALSSRCVARDVSIHEVLVYLVLKAAGTRWMSNDEIAAATPSVAKRTVRTHTMRLAHLGILERAYVFPGHRYRMARDAATAPHLRSLEGAAAVFGIQPTKATT